MYYRKANWKDQGNSDDTIRCLDTKQVYYSHSKYVLTKYENNNVFKKYFVFESAKVRPVWKNI